jgi:hypothetical protein
MSASVQEIVARLTAGDDSLTEFKELRFGDRPVIPPDSEDLAGEMVAFAKTEGGLSSWESTTEAVSRGCQTTRRQWSKAGW